MGYLDGLDFSDAVLNGGEVEVIQSFVHLHSDLIDYFGLSNELAFDVICQVNPEELCRNVFLFGGGVTENFLLRLPLATCLRLSVFF